MLLVVVVLGSGLIVLEGLFLSCFNGRRLLLVVQVEDGLVAFDELVDLFDLIDCLVFVLLVVCILLVLGLFCVDQL